MKRRLTGRVQTIVAERAGAQEILVAPLAEENAAAAPRPAINFPQLTGVVAVGDRVLLNIVAMELGLGTGGSDFVIANLDREPEHAPPAGHILKLRYTPLQTPVLAVSAPESPHHDALRLFASLDDTPVVCAELHSQLPAACVAAHWSLKHNGCSAPKIAYIMTEGAALPLALSRLVPELKARGLITATITSGQAFGGDYEAVNIYSALAAAKSVLDADIIIVGQGPGNVGTATPLGFSGIEQGQALNAAASLGGIPIVVARISFADKRERHRGLSHHTLSVLKYVARAPSLVPFPRLPEAQMEILLAELDESGLSEEHQPVFVHAEPAMDYLASTDLPLDTMGRKLSEERPFFLSAVSAGLLAAQLVEARLA